MPLLKGSSLETLFAVASDLSTKQAALREMISISPDPEFVLELSKSVREISRVNRKIAQIIREQGDQRRKEMFLVKRGETVAAWTP